MESLRIENVSFGYDVVIEKGLGKTEDRFLHVLNKANLSIQRGEIICICGRSGQGKSTLLRMLGGLEHPSNGRVMYYGMEMESHSALEIFKQNVSFVFQNCALISNLTVFDNVALPLRYHRICSEDEIKDRVRTNLNKMMVDKNLFRSFPHMLSAGILKRVAVARAMVSDPQILLMDEPTSGLDNLNRRSFMALISNMHLLHMSTIVVVTHDLFLARDLDAKISFLHDGKLSPLYNWQELAKVEDQHIKDMVQELIKKDHV